MQILCYLDHSIVSLKDILLSGFCIPHIAHFLICFFVYQFNSLSDLHSVSVMYAPGSKHMVFAVYCFVLCALYSVQYIKYFFNKFQCQISLCETSYESSCIQIYGSERMMKLFCLDNWQRIPQSFSVTDTPAKLCRAWYKFWREELCEENE